MYLAHYLDANIFPGIDEAAYAFVGGLSTSQITSIAPLASTRTSTLGTTPTLCIGVVLETAGLVGASFAT
jgi:hypothetical protein